MFDKRKKKKRIRYLVLSLLFTVLIMWSAFAEGPTRFSMGQELQSYVIANANVAGTGATKLVTHFSVTTEIVPQYHRILGFYIQPYNTSLNSEQYIGLYDGTAKSYLSDTTYLFDEAEAISASIPTLPRWYPYPKRLSTGLTVIQGPNTVATIYYEDTRKF